MTHDERHAHFQRLIDQHDAAIQALREAARASDQTSAGFDQALAGMHEAMAGIRRTNAAHTQVIETVLAANREVLALLNGEDHSA